MTSGQSNCSDDGQAVETAQVTQARTSETATTTTVTSNNANELVKMVEATQVGSPKITTPASTKSHLLIL